MFPERDVQLLDYKGGKDYQNSGWLIDTETVNDACRDEMAYALEVV